MSQNKPGETGGIPITVQISPRFQANDGDLTIKVPGEKNVHKFCAMCCYVITRGEDRLQRHCNRAHHSYNFGFLQYGFLPLIDQWCYENFVDYLEDPNIDLIEKEGNKV